MTFKEFMQDIGYDLKTTFWDDFSRADTLGEKGIRDTYKMAFEEWKCNYVYLTELVIVLNHKIWYHYEANKEMAALYDELWRETDSYAMSNLKDDELSYYYQITD